MANKLWQYVRFSICVGISLIAMGCTSSVTVPATELPRLGKELANPNADWPDVLTAEGKVVRFAHTVESLSVQSGYRIDQYGPSFRAEINGWDLLVTDGYKEGRYPLAKHPTSTLEVSNGRTIGGGVLVGLGTVPVLLGTSFFIAGVAQASRNYSFKSLDGALTAAFGVILAIPGLALTIPGIVLLAKEPKKPGYIGRTTVEPRLQLGPGSAGLTVLF